MLAFEGGCKQKAKYAFFVEITNFVQKTMKNRHYAGHYRAECLEHAHYYIMTNTK